MTTKNNTKNLYKIIYDDNEIEYDLSTEELHKIETIRLKNLGVKFTVKKVNHLKKTIN